jgi:hypothetical protein
LKRSLLEAVRGLLERTYRISCGLDDLAPFVIGDRGYRALYGSPRVSCRVAAADDPSARTLVRETDEGIAACIYFPDDMIRRLESFPPWDGVGEENLGAFATLVEEVDHLLVIAERVRRGRPVTLLELELHAEVSKYLVLERFLAGAARRLDPGRRLWLRRRLFEDVRYSDREPGARERYREAARWAVRLIDGLNGLERAGRLEVLRRFHDAELGAKLRLIGLLSVDRPRPGGCGPDP